MKLIHPLPSGVVSQRFGANPADYAEFGLLGHEGIDLSAPVGMPVMAAHDGTVAVRLESPTYGNYATVTAATIETLYAHLSGVTAVMSVQAGDIVGWVGSTGRRSTGPHLHFGVKPLPADLGNGYKGWANPEGWIYAVPYGKGDLLRTGEEQAVLIAARWHAEEAVRQIEQTIESLQAARKRLIEETIPKLYEAERG